MTRPIIRAASLACLAAALALLQLSCATSGSPPVSSAMPAARASLRPEYRVFYDELQDYGDWVLIEPYGFVFRPRTRFGNWSPYYDGFWSPSDSYGWVWVSGEPFGWATYHYGAWIDDDFQGWVWVPGLDWAPAWVAWTGNQSYVGWAALTPSGDPAGRYMVVPVSQLGDTDLRSHVLAADKATAALKDARPIQELAQVDKVVVNRGPSIEWVEQSTGPLRRARLEDVGQRLGDDRAPEIAPSTADDQEERASRPKSLPSATEFKKTTENEASKARSIMQQKQPAPDVIPRILVSDAPLRPAPGPPKGFRPAKRDTVH